MKIRIGIITTKFINRSLHFRYICSIITFEKHSSIFLRVRHFQHIRCFLNTYIPIIGNFSFLITLSFFGSDNNNTIGSTHTVDSSSRSILQHGHILNVITVKEIDIIIEHTVYNIKRRAVGK